MAYTNKLAASYSKDADKGFWELHSDFAVAGPFKAFWRSTNEHYPVESSMFMWFLVLMYDPDSRYFRQSEADKFTLLSTDYFDAEGFLMNKCGIGPDKIDATMKYYKDSFIDFCDDAVTADLRAMLLKLKERQEFIKSTPYSLDHLEYAEDEDGNPVGKPKMVKGNGVMLDKMVVEGGKLHATIDALVAKRSSLGGGGRVKGGSAESL